MEMNRRCVKCGSANVVEGRLATGTGGLLFTEKSAKEMVFRGSGGYTALVADGCKDCGAVFDIRMADPQALDK